MDFMKSSDLHLYTAWGHTSIFTIHGIRVWLSYFMDFMKSPDLYLQFVSSQVTRTS